MSFVKSLVLGICDTFTISFTVLSFAINESIQLASSQVRAKKILAIGVLLFLFQICLSIICYISNSICLALLYIWCEKYKLSTDSYCFGVDRFQVVAVFGGTMLTILSSFFLIKEAVERMFEPDFVHIDYLFPTALLSFGIHSFITYGIYNPPLKHVIDSSSSNWFQLHLTDVCESITKLFPKLSMFLLPRLNPISLAGTLICSLVLYVYIDLSGNTSLLNQQFYHSGSHENLSKISLELFLVDTVCGVIAAFIMIITMLPISIYSGRILLQTTPLHLTTPLDKALRECSTLEGVLEIRQEHFWSLGFGCLVGSVWVRIRRDADHQTVLAQVTNHLSDVAQRLTIQVYKDTWSSAQLSYQRSEQNANGHTSGLLPPNNQNKYSGGRLPSTIVRM